MRHIRVDVDALRDTARRLASLASAFVPITPHSAIGSRAFGFTALESALAQFATSIDAELGDMAREVTKQAQGVESASSKFAAYESQAESAVNALTRQL